MVKTKKLNLKTKEMLISPLVIMRFIWYIIATGDRL